MKEKKEYSVFIIIYLYNKSNFFFQNIKYKLTLIIIIIIIITIITIFY